MPNEPFEQFGEREMHRLFRALREHVATVAEAFTRRVLFRVQAHIEEQLIQGPSLGELVSDSAVESTNLVVGFVREQLEEEPAPGDETAEQPVTDVDGPSVDIDVAPPDDEQS